MAASIVAEPLVPSALSAFGMKPGERDHSAAIFATGGVAAGGYEPVHLQVHCAQQVMKAPRSPHLRRIRRVKKIKPRLGLN